MYSPHLCMNNLLWFADIAMYNACHECPYIGFGSWPLQPYGPARNHTLVKRRVLHSLKSTGSKVGISGRNEGQVSKQASTFLASSLHAKFGHLQLEFYKKWDVWPFKAKASLHKQASDTHVCSDRRTDWSAFKSSLLMRLIPALMLSNWSRCASRNNTVSFTLASGVLASAGWQAASTSLGVAAWSHVLEDCLVLRVATTLHRVRHPQNSSTSDLHYTLFHSPGPLLWVCPSREGSDHNATGRLTSDCSPMQCNSV